MTQKDPVNAAGTTMEMIEVISELDGARVSDVPAELSLPRSTDQNYLETLEGNEYLVNKDGIYRVGLRFLGHGEWARSRLDISEIAKPELKELATETGEFVTLLVEDNGSDVDIYRAKWNKATQIHTCVSIHIRKRTYFHSIAAGKAILANVEQERVRRFWIVTDYRR